MKEYSAAAKRFYKSKTWERCRESYIKSVGGLCERCLAKGLIVPGKIVHHKIYLNEDKLTDPDVLLNWDNLEYLCVNCHNEEHFQYKHRRYNINADGSVEINV